VVDGEGDELQAEQAITAARATDPDTVLFQRRADVIGNGIVIGNGVAAVHRAR
jgi:hypothetical protein